MRYHLVVADPVFQAHLTAILQQLRLQRADGKLPPDVARAQVDLLLARVAALTGALRNGAQPDNQTSASMRLLLADLAMVTAQFRGHTNAVGEQLARALENARSALDKTVDAPAPAE